MAFKITDDCINCGVCKAECKLNAVYPPGVNWRDLHDNNFLFLISPAYRDKYFSEKYFYIVPEICNSCAAYPDEPKCVIACPLGCIVEYDLPNETALSDYSKKSLYEASVNSYKINRHKFAGEEF